MIIELIGPMAVGKSTIAPMLARRLGIADYQGQGFHGLDNQPLTTAQLWSDRLWSVLRKPALFANAARLHKGSARDRTTFALNICRRDRFISIATRAPSGVVAGGPVHAIAQMGAWIERDLTSLGREVTKADFYVRLSAEPAEVKRRLSTRPHFPKQYVDRHEEWIKSYDRSVAALLDLIERPVVDVSANEAPEIVAEAIATALGPLTGAELA